MLNDSHHFYARDTVRNDHLQPRFLRCLAPSDMPPYRLKLKPGTIVELVQNLSATDGLYEGAQMIIRSIKDEIFEAELLEGDFAGKTVFVPMFEFESSLGLEFVLRRYQFPVRVTSRVKTKLFWGPGPQHIDL